MIFTFDAKRTITARIAIEAETLEDASRKFSAISLQNADYPSIEDDTFCLQTTYETWESAVLADDHICPPPYFPRYFPGTIGRKKW